MTLKIGQSASTKNQRQFWICLLFLSLFIGCFTYGIKDANAVRVSLKRVVFEGKKRSETLTIINNTAEEKTYRLGWRKYRMSERKSLGAIEEGAPSDDILWADDMIRFAPRRITVAAGNSQQIRLLFRRPKDLQEAEYRSHLWIVTESKPEKFTVDENGEKLQSIRLAVQPAISLPIFARNGDLKVTTTISDAELSKTESGLNIAFTLNREGNRSVYGDFDFVCTDSGTDHVLRQIRGISVYTEIERRYLNFDLPLDGEDTPDSCNAVKIVYKSDPNDSVFKGSVLAESTAALK